MIHDIHFFLNIRAKIRSKTYKGNLIGEMPFFQSKEDFDKKLSFWKKCLFLIKRIKLLEKKCLFELKRPSQQLWSCRDVASIL